jgi:hypothetical protein
MAHLIGFKTSKFDPFQEPPNPINPIHGRSILEWLRTHVIPGAIEPDCEDWGWYTEVEFQGASYLVGGICFMPDEGESAPPYEWLLQIHKNRRFMEKLLGRNKLLQGDPLVTTIAAAIRSEEEFVEVEERADA